MTKMQKANPVRFLYAAAAAGLILGVSSQASAAAFAVMEQNVTNLGTAYSGTAAQAEDASTGYYNSAGLMNLKNDQFVVSLVGLKASTKFTPTSATMNGLAAGIALAPLNSTKPKGQALIPSLHLGKRLTDKWVFGFNVASPFGLRTIYKHDSIARLMATRSQLRTVDFSPSLAYRVNDQLSIGGGVDFLYAKAWLDADILTNAGGGFSENFAKGWAYSFHLGMLYELSDATRIGLSYRHKYKAKAHGNSQTSIPALAVNTFERLDATVNLPEKLTYSVYHQYDDKWAMMGDMEWTHWSRFKELKLVRESTTLITPQNYRNVFRFAVGMNYFHDENWTFKGGIAYEQSPTRDKNRTARIPDSNRLWFGLGAGYKWNKNINLDAGYAFLKFRKAALNEDAPIGIGVNPAILHQTLQGEYRSKAHIVGIQLTWNFV